jgi:cation diffusion facilitator CzcD-associated flavoprotein CzcO/3-oxoacyl-(acyl-carrier-protein) synthase
MTSRKKNVAIIGGGPGGIGTAKSLREQGHEVTVFEASDSIGGLWRYDEKRRGGVYSTTMYQTTKFISSFCDFPFDDGVSAFPMHHEFLAYLEKYAGNFDLGPCFRLGHSVERAALREGKWELTIAHRGERLFLVFDAIAVCTGQYWRPSLPQVPGRERFRGQVLHSVDYKEKGVFRGKRVIVAGAGVTGMDLAVESSKVAERTLWSVKGKNWLKPRWLGLVPYEAGVAEGVHLSREQLLENWKRWIPEFHEKAEKFDLLPDREPFREGFLANDDILDRLESGAIGKKGRIESFTEDGVRFEDGSEEPADLVMFASGYEGFSFPFFEAGILVELAIHEEGMDLYKHVFHPRIPHCAFIFHVTGNAPALPTIELQSRWYAAVLGGSLALPGEEEMAALIRRERERRKTALNPRPYRSNFVDTTYLMQLAGILGVLPDRTADWSAYLDLIKPPSFPPIFRMFGPGKWDKARKTIENLRDKYPIKIAMTREWKLQVLKGCSQSELLRLYRNKQIGREEVRAAWSGCAEMDVDAAAGPKANPSVTVKPAQERLLVSGLKGLIFEILKINPDDIDENRDMSQYGFNSITLGKFATAMKSRLGFNVPPTSFFEHTTLSQYSRYLLSSFEEEVSAYLEKRTVPANGVRAAGPAPGPARPEAQAQSQPQSQPQPEKPAPAFTLERPEEKGSGDVAVIGLQGRFPGADSPREFWKNLEAGGDFVSPSPAGRFDWQRMESDPRYKNARSLLKKGGYIENIDQFDAEFFSISEREASLMDPQQRLLLESVWHLVEDAGYALSDLNAAPVGLFIGCSSLDYNERIFEARSEADINAIGGVSYCMMANRISFLLNLTGPSETVDTACSSSMVAVHRAIQSLREGDCKTAIAGGVNLLISPGRTLGLTLAGMLSKDGRTCSFGGGATGFVRGEGVGSVLLKPLADALRDQDRIYGIIKGSAVNHNGRANSMYTPNPVCQARVIENAIRKSGIPASSISYVEAQGTGNMLSDSLEFGALGSALSNAMSPSERAGFRCLVGSVKSNIGNLEAASGMASLAKVLMAMKHRRIPASIHCETLNPDLGASGLDLKVITEAADWDKAAGSGKAPGPLRAGISAFGIGGTNVHLVLEEFREAAAQAPKASLLPIFALSAKNRQRLLEYARRIQARLEDAEEGFSFEQILHTLQVGREQFGERLAFVCGSLDELNEKLAKALGGGDKPVLPGIFLGGAGEAKSVASVLNKTVESFPYIAALVEGGKHEELARLWAAGVDIKWRSFARADRSLKVSLPGYPFQPKKHWVANPENRRVEKRVAQAIP